MCTAPDVRMPACMIAYIEAEYPDCRSTFKVKVRRINKDFEGHSMEMDADLGGAILEHFPEMKVDVHDPDILFDVEIREKTYIYSRVIPGPGGMKCGIISVTEEGYVLCEAAEH